MTHDLSAIRQNATTQLDMKASAASVLWKVSTHFLIETRPVCHGGLS